VASDEKCGCWSCEEVRGRLPGANGVPGHIVAYDPDDNSFCFIPVDHYRQIADVPGSTRVNWLKKSLR
jgi:hypothetical protein